MTSQPTNGGPRLELLASTGNTANTPTQRQDVVAGQHHTSQDQLDPFIESAHWTADGTFVLTSSSDNQIAGYIVPEDLLMPKTSPLHLAAPSCRIQLPERSNVLASAPYFSLSEPYTHQVLVSSRDHPIQLYYLQPSSPVSSNADEDADAELSSGTEAVAGQGTLAGVYPAASSFPFIKPRSETFETATSLIWPAPGYHFIAGTRNMLAKFDVSRTGSGPIMHVKTVPTESRGGGGRGAGAGGRGRCSFGSLRGTISAMGTQPSSGDTHGASGEGTGLIAAGTWTRWVGLYDFASSGQCVATWGVASAAAQTVSEADDKQSNAGNEDTATRTGGGIGGAGITQTIWSPCGRYLLINERRSTGILVYDIRVTGKLLGWLAGREARGNQRIACDVYPSSSSGSGFEVWSGTTRGVVKVWEGVGSREGAHDAAWDWQAHEAAVGSACLHQSGSVVATVSGSWEFSSPGEATSSTPSVDSACSASTESAESTDSGSGNEDWLHRKVKESSLKLWGIAVNSDHDDDDAYD
ncbi:telomerase Cajal body protein 1 [Microdochium nivale]|nr:telomerase Cajal body protein 1 [Microdochium nivale]